MAKLRYTVTYEVDKDILCDQDTIDLEFNGSWQEWLEWFAKEELGEVLMGLDTDPVAFTVITDVETPEERKETREERHERLTDMHPEVKK